MLQNFVYQPKHNVLNVIADDQIKDHEDVIQINFAMNAIYMLKQKGELLKQSLVYTELAELLRCEFNVSGVTYVHCQ